jgi:hypothetical protein
VPHVIPPVFSLTVMPILPLIYTVCSGDAAQALVEKQPEAAGLLLSAQADPLVLCNAPWLVAPMPPGTSAANGQDEVTELLGKDQPAGTSSSPGSKSESGSATSAAAAAANGTAPSSEHQQASGGGEGVCKTTVAHLLLGDGGGLPWPPEMSEEWSDRMIKRCMEGMLGLVRLDEHKEAVPLTVALNTTVNSAGGWGWLKPLAGADTGRLHRCLGGCSQAAY